MSNLVQLMEEYRRSTTEAARKSLIRTVDEINAMSDHEFNAWLKLAVVADPPFDEEAMKAIEERFWSIPEPQTGNAYALPAETQ